MAEIPMRKKYQLTPEEFAEWQALPQESSEQDRAMGAWMFWNRVARARGVDSASLLATHVPNTFTALPLGHGKAWCWPQAIKCKRLPEEFEPRIIEVGA
jgi:hypothetical protein